MDIFDKIALMGRRYEQRRSAQTGRTQLGLPDVLTMFNGKAILELSSHVDGKEGISVKPDSERKLKVSLLDGMAEIHVDPQGWYEVFETAPTGDLSKVRIVAYSPDGRASGELRMLVGRRTLEHYFIEDPLIASLRERGELP